MTSNIASDSPSGTSNGFLSLFTWRKKVSNDNVTVPPPAASEKVLEDQDIRLRAGKKGDSAIEAILLRQDLLDTDTTNNKHFISQQWHLNAYRILKGDKYLNFVSAVITVRVKAIGDTKGRPTFEGADTSEKARAELIHVKNLEPWRSYAESGFKGRIPVPDNQAKSPSNWNLVFDPKSLGKSSITFWASRGSGDEASIESTAFISTIVAANGPFELSCEVTALLDRGWIWGFFPNKTFHDSGKEVVDPQRLREEHDPGKPIVWNGELFGIAPKPETHDETNGNEEVPKSIVKMS